VDVLYGYECDVVYRYDVMNYNVYEYDVMNYIVYGSDKVLSMAMCMDVMKYCILCMDVVYVFQVLNFQLCWLFIFL
jgi:hypothetical protein